MKAPKRIRRGSAKAVLSKRKVNERTRKERRLRQDKIYNGGKWSETEKLLFLQGLRVFGAGHWKKIGTILTTR